MIGQLSQSILVGAAEEDLGLDARDGLRDGEKVCEVGVLDAHLARRSSSSLSSSMILATRALNSGSLRR